MVWRWFSATGRVEASNLLTDMRLQRILAHLPALMHPKPRSALVVGLGVANEVTYNYTVNTPASQLQQIFEGLSYQQDHMQTLQRTLKYDRLGLYDALGYLETDLDNGVIPEPEHLLPVLEQIANDTHVIEIARSRARAITARIRNAK